MEWKVTERCLKTLLSKSLRQILHPEPGYWLPLLKNLVHGLIHSLFLDDDSIHIATGLRLDANIVEEHTCICGSIVDRMGQHGLSCRRSGGRISRHHAANETIRRALVSGGVPAVFEPVGICWEDTN